MRGEDFLRAVDAVTLRLENGEVVEFEIAVETEIPTDPEELDEAQRRSPAKYAFWDYQARRALEDVEKQEMRTTKVEARHYDLYRTFITEELAIDPTEAMIAAKLNQDTEVRRSRLALRRVRKVYRIVRAVADAVGRRDSMLRAFRQRYDP